MKEFQNNLGIGYEKNKIMKNSLCSYSFLAEIISISFNIFNKPG